MFSKLLVSLGLTAVFAACDERGRQAMTKPATGRDVISTAAAAQGGPGARQPGLHDALLNNRRKAFEDLLRAGADPNELAADGTSVMHLAARHQDSWWLEALLAKGANANLRHARSGVRPIMDAVQTHRDTNIDLLLRGGADVNATNNAGETALHVAAATNRAAYSLKFLKAGADPKARDGLGNTFQAYQFMPPDDRLSADIRRDRDAIRAWLRDKGIAVEQR
jgi:hypothetical protein